MAAGTLVMSTIRLAPDIDLDYCDPCFGLNGLAQQSQVIRAHLRQARNGHWAR
eukprot:CAMPEP_0172912130 /NCGR_PEP_ID=MMETSP1075-20121228/187848_1 /TAXON_ID=2916 /ORGANISM="Ceratium fusus, Strain PA161109" /LENGTH=52 /DNA_ID=CAMNT_0013770555 /DNA_START=776 /DNA_END=934 /DNA_ORIENTATION=+